MSWTKEVSPSRTALKLEEGDLVLEVRKLGKESSFLVKRRLHRQGYGEPSSKYRQVPTRRNCLYWKAELTF